jgi:hypothetical protein
MASPRTSCTQSKNLLVERKIFPSNQKMKRNSGASAKGMTLRLSDALLWVRFLRMILRRVFGRGTFGS